MMVMQYTEKIDRKPAAVNDSVYVVKKMAAK